MYTALFNLQEDQLHGYQLLLFSQKEDSTDEEPSIICNGSQLLFIGNKAAVCFCDLNWGPSYCDDSGACSKQDQIHQSRPSRPVQVVNMDHKQDNGQLLVDERSGQISQSPSKHSVGNTEEPEEDTHFNPSPPSPWKRAALIVLICFLFYLGFSMRFTLLRDQKYDIVYASR